MANSIIGTNGSIGAPFDAEQAAAPAPLEHGDDDAVGGADREQVHDHRLERHEQRPEHDHQQQERQAQHGGEEVRQRVGQVVGEVDADGDAAGDGDVEPGSGRGGGEHVVAQPVDEVGRRRVLRARSSG